MKTETYRDRLIKLGWFLGVGLVFYLFFAYALPLLLPFVAAFLFAVMLKSPAEWIAKHLHLPRRMVSTVLVTGLYILLALLVLLCGSKVVDFAGSAVARYNGRIVPAVQDITAALGAFVEKLDPSLVSILEELSSNLIGSLGAKVASLSTSLLSGVVTNLPSLLLKVLFAIIATYFMALDYGVLRRGIQRRMEPALYGKVSTGFSYFCKTIGTYLRSYGLIFLVTFGELALGLLVVGIDNSFLIALLIALFDILPVVGSGMIMLPWALITLIRGYTARGIGLMIVYLVVVIARQFQEPAIVGDRVGLHPLVTLMAMFIGYQLFGGLGLWGVPILCALLQALDRDGVIRLFPYQDVPEELAEEKPKVGLLEKIKKLSKKI